jgi:ABC-type lipoprotein release transport system permease subunit
VLTHLEPLDVTTAGFVAILVIVVTMLAAVVPALRATQAQLSTVLRAD